MDLLKVKAETQETYKNDSKSTLKLIIFLTKVLKNLHTQTAVFILLLPFVLVPAIYFYNATHNLLIFLVAVVIHFIGFKIVLHLYNKDSETLEETYREQACIQETLEEMLKNK